MGVAGVSGSGDPKGPCPASGPSPCTAGTPLAQCPGASSLREGKPGHSSLMSVEAGKCCGQPRPSRQSLAPQLPESASLTDQRGWPPRAVLAEGSDTRRAARQARPAAGLRPPGPMSRARQDRPVCGRGLFCPVSARTAVRAPYRGLAGRRLWARVPPASWAPCFSLGPRVEAHCVAATYGAPQPRAQVSPLLQHLVAPMPADH